MSKKYLYINQRRMQFFTDTTYLTEFLRNDDGWQCYKGSTDLQLIDNMQIDLLAEGYTAIAEKKVNMPSVLLCIQNEAKYILDNNVNLLSEINYNTCVVMTNHIVAPKYQSLRALDILQYNFILHLKKQNKVVDNTVVYLLQSSDYFIDKLNHFYPIGSKEYNYKYYRKLWLQFIIDYKE